MFGRPPKPGSPKAKQQYYAIRDARIRDAKNYELDSGQLAESQWKSYEADHPGEKQWTSRPSLRPGGGTVYKNHPEYVKMLQAHNQRMDEYTANTVSLLNSAHQRLIDPSNPFGAGWNEQDRTGKTQALQETHNKMLNSQQFGHLPEYGESY